MPRRPDRPHPSPGSTRRKWRRSDEPSDASTDGAPGLPPAAPGDGTGSAQEQERLIIEALADLRDMSVREVMTPRIDVVALPIPVHAEDVARVIRESGRHCFPVYGDDLDDLIGILYVNDLFRTGWRPGPAPGPDARGAPGPLDISRHLRQPFVIPESRTVLDVLAEMRRQHRAFAVVVDEYGGVAGVLTVKDLLGALVGDLHDEFDGTDEPAVVRVDQKRWLIDGGTSVDDVRDRLGIEIPDGEYVTLGGYLFDGFGHIPKEGERLPVGRWELRVVEMDRRRIAKVVAKLVAPGGQEAAAEDGGPAEADAPDT